MTTSKSISYVFILFLTTISCKEKTKSPNRLYASPTTECEGNCIFAQEGAKHVGESIKVYGTIKEVFTKVDFEPRKPTFINLDDKYPDQKFNIVIFEEDYDKFPDMSLYVGKNITVTGVVEMQHFIGNKDKGFLPSDYPQIKVTSLDQIEVLNCK